MTDNKNLHQLIEKHKPMTKRDVIENIKQHAEIKKNITTNAAELEANLKKFNEITDPLIDPETGNALCWIRRPTTLELENMIPLQLMEYKNSPETIPKDIMKKYGDFQFEMMANLITNPKKDMEFWKTNTNLVFQSLFQKHLSGVLEDLGISAENF
jgi:hypothetical protein